MKKYLFQKFADFIIYSFDLFDEIEILERLYITGLILDTIAHYYNIELN